MLTAVTDSAALPAPGRAVSATVGGRLRLFDPFTAVRFDKEGGQSSLVQFHSGREAKLFCGLPE